MLKKYLFVVFISLGFLVSCNPDDDVINDGGTTTTDARTKFLGSWKCKETTDKSEVTNYNLSIEVDPTNPVGILFRNFYAFGNDQKVMATIDGNNITISKQSYCSHDVSGSGYIDSKKTTIILDYTVNDNAGLKVNCSAICTKN